jgi:hypothetical protein
MTAIWTTIAIGSLGLGFLVGHLSGSRLRRFCFAALLAFPVLLLAVGLALTPPAPPSWDFWASGMAMSGPMFLLWFALSTVAFVAARRSVR